MSIDMNRVGVLLHVISEGVQHGSAYRDIISEADVELQWINGVAKQDGLNRAKAEAEEKARAEAEVEAEAEDHQPAPPSGDGEPGPDATMTTAVERRV